MAVIFWASFNFTVIIGFGRLSYGLLLPGIQSDLGLSYSEAGLIATGHFSGYLLGSLVLNTRFGTRFSPTKLNLAAQLILSLSLICSAFAASGGQLLLWRGLGGLVSALANTLTVSLLLAQVRPNLHGKANGYLWAGSGLGIVISGFSGYFLAQNWQGTLVFMGCLGLVGSVGTYRVTRQIKLTLANPSGNQTLKLLFLPDKLLFLTLTHAGFAFSYILFATFFSSLLVSQGISLSSLAMLWVILGSCAAIGSLGWGRIIDRSVSNQILALGLFVSALAIPGVLLGSPLAILLSLGLFGLTVFAPSVIVTVLVRRAVQEEDYPGVHSGFTTIFALGQLSGPAIGGVVSDKLGLELGIWLAALVMLLSAAFAGCYHYFRKRTFRAN